MLTPLINDWRRIGSSMSKGATTCLLEAVHALRKFVGREIIWQEGSERLPGILLETIPGFSPIEWLAWRIDASVWVNESPFDLCVSLSELSEILHKYRNHQVRFIRDQIANTPVVVYSAGSTVSQLLSTRSSADPPVFIAEGRPGNEGVALAQQLYKRGVTVRILTDTGISSKLDDESVLLLGSDRITRTSFYHKVGTIPVVEMAHQRGATVIALADPLKRNPPDPWSKLQHRLFRRPFPGNPELQLEGPLLEEVPWREAVVNIFMGDKIFHPNDDAQWDDIGRTAMKMLGWPVA